MEVVQAKATLVSRSRLQSPIPAELSNAVAALVIMLAASLSGAQSATGRPLFSANQNQGDPSAGSRAVLSLPAQDEEELRKGTELTRHGLFADAIPHLLAARGRASQDYALNFNLALCYVGTSQFQQAIKILDDLRSGGHDGADVHNLLAQAYVGNGQPQEALASLQKAASLSPQNEKLYSFVADACMDHRDYRLGVKVVDIGLRNLPLSARLHYERALFLVQLDEIDQSKQDFEQAAKLAQGSEIGYLADGNEELLEGNISEAIRIAREGVKKGYQNHALLTILGEALIRSGATPGQSDFLEAQAALENSVTQRPNDPTSQIALGNLYMMAGRVQDAIVHLEKARQLDPSKPSVYANLAKAYQRRGDVQRAQEALTALERLNRDEADRIRVAPGDGKLGYAGSGVSDEEPAKPHR